MKPTARIPLALQKVFLDGAQDKDVVEAPKEAFRVYQRPEANQQSHRWSWGTAFRGRKRNDSSAMTDDSSTGGSSDPSIRNEGLLGSSSYHRSRRNTRAMNPLEQLEMQLQQLDAMKARKNRRKDKLSGSTRGASITCTPLSSDNPMQMKPTEHYSSLKSPMEFLNVMLRTRGYSQDCFNTLETGYYRKPSELELASYAAPLVQLAKTTVDLELLKEILSCGIAPNPSNFHGESLFSEICRCGLEDVAKAMLEIGGPQVAQRSDDAGRTSLHAAFRGQHPSFQMVDLLMTADRHLIHLRDHHGKLPFDYIARDQWGTWTDFLYNRRDRYWPQRHKRLDGIAPPGALMKQDSRSMYWQNPDNILPLEMVKMVASLKLTPDEVRYLLDEEDQDDDSYESDDDSDTYSCFSTDDELSIICAERDMPVACYPRKCTGDTLEVDTVATNFSGYSVSEESLPMVVGAQ